MFKIYDGREHFYQWDLNRKLIVEDSSIKEVHFCNKTENIALVCEVYTEAELKVVDVPNILLQESWRINVYAFDGEMTKHSTTFGVVARTKPADYIYTETEVKNYEVYGERLAAIEATGVKTITLAKSERIYAKDLEAGIYKIDIPEGLAGVVFGRLFTVPRGKNNYLYIGGAYTEATADTAGLTQFDKPYLFLYTATSKGVGYCNIGSFRGTKGEDDTWTYEMVVGGSNPITLNDLVYKIDDTNATVANKAVTPKALTTYIPEKLAELKEKEIDWTKIYSYNTTDLATRDMGTVKAFSTTCSDIKPYYNYDGTGNTAYYFIFSYFLNFYKYENETITTVVDTPFKLKVDDNTNQPYITNIDNVVDCGIGLDGENTLFNDMLEDSVDGEVILDARVTINGSILSSSDNSGVGGMNCSLMFICSTTEIAETLMPEVSELFGSADTFLIKYQNTPVVETVHAEYRG